MQKHENSLPFCFGLCVYSRKLLPVLVRVRETQEMEGNPYHYVYEEYEEIHGWDYWDEHIIDFLKYLEKFLKK